MKTPFTRAQSSKGRSNLNTVPQDQPTDSDQRDQTNPDANGAALAPAQRPQSILAEIGVFGCESLEPLIIASLATEEPLLLIGPHGTGKSLLLNRISIALGISWRHYNASILNFDDLIGFPSPKEDGSLSYIQTENSIWGANAVFFDEISRCRPDIQNKMFPIVHERRVQGIELQELRFRWAAMNPPASDTDVDDYLGSEQLDIAFADRFGFVIEMPEWESFEERERQAVVRANGASADHLSSRLKNAVDITKELLPSYEESHGERVVDYVLAVGNLLAETGLILSPRRLNKLRRSILAVYASAIPINLKTNLSDLTYLVLKNSLPMRCTGQEIKDIKLLTAHRSAWQLVSMPKRNPLRSILETKDPLARLRIAATSNEIRKGQRSTVISDVLAKSSMGVRAAIVLYMFENDLVGKLNAAVAEELGSLYQVMVQPKEFTESVYSGSQRFQVWNAVEEFISKLDQKNRLSNLLANYLAHLFVENSLTSEQQIRSVHDDWDSTCATLGVSSS